MGEHYTPGRSVVLLAQALLEPTPDAYEALRAALIAAHGYEWFRERQESAFIIITKRGGE